MNVAINFDQQKVSRPEKLLEFIVYENESSLFAVFIIN